MKNCEHQWFVDEYREDSRGFTTIYVATRLKCALCFEKKEIPRDWE